MSGIDAIAIGGGGRDVIDMNEGGGIFKFTTTLLALTLVDGGTGIDTGIDEIDGFVSSFGGGIFTTGGKVEG